MRILIHTQFYPPEMGAPQARLSDLGRRLKELGHEVEVLTAMPNYPAGRIFDGYRGFHRTEVMDGIRVCRSWIIPSNKKSMAHRLVSYISFSVSSFLAGLIGTGKADVIITESPPLFLAVSGLLLARIKGARWIMNVSDLWPDSAKYIGMLSEERLIYRMMKRLALFLYRNAWLVTGQSREIIEEIKRQEDAAGVYHLSNGVDAERFDPSLRSEDIRRRYLKDGETGFIYAGLHGFFQGLDQVMAAAGRLGDLPVRFILIGEGAEKGSLVRMASDLGLGNVDFYPPLPHEKIPAVLASMDVAMITLKSPIRGAVPSKIYEAMASGIPVLLVAEGEAKDIVKRADAGVVVDTGDIDGIVRAVRGFVSDGERRRRMGRSGRSSALGLYDRREIAKRFENALL